jgi:subtilisin family serine protease
MAKGSHYIHWLVRLCAGIALCFTTVGEEQCDYRPGRVIVRPKAGEETRLEHFRKGRKHKLKKRLEHVGSIQIVDTDPGEDPAAAAKAYAASGLVEFAEPDYILRAYSLPTDPEFSKVWSLQSSAAGDTDAPDAWNVRTSAELVIVAVIDSGVRYTHEDLAANMWRNPRELANGFDDDGNGIVDDIHGYNAVDRSGDPDDDNGHGTHVAGTIGAVANNGKGVAGVCWKVKIMALKFMTSEGEGATSDAISCINYARANGARVINASWGSAYGGYALRSAIASARNAGIIFVTAAGNDAANNDRYPSYPANYSLDNIISVGASDQTGGLDTGYSNYGAKTVDLVAPGTAIYSTWNSSDHAYTTLSGTSMAAPHVAGAIALLRAAYPSESYAAIISRLYAATDKLSSLETKTVTGGRLNIGALFPPSSSTITRPQPISIPTVTLRAAGVFHITLPEGSESFRLETSSNLKDWTSVEIADRTIGVDLAADRARQFFRLVDSAQSPNG